VCVVSTNRVVRLIGGRTACLKTMERIVLAVTDAFSCSRRSAMSRSCSDRVIPGRAFRPDKYAEKIQMLADLGRFSWCFRQHGVVCLSRSGFIIHGGPSNPRGFFRARDRLSQSLGGVSLAPGLACASLKPVFE